MQFNNIFLLILLGLGFSCSDSSGGLESTFSITKASKAKRGVSNIVVSTGELNSENGKSSDDDEGIPGYMSDVSIIEANVQDGEYTVSAPESTVVRSANSNVYATVWIIASDAIDRAGSVIKEGKSATARFVGYTQVAENGSFYFAAAEPASGEKLVFGISFDPTPDSLVFATEMPETYAGFYISKPPPSPNNRGSKPKPKSFATYQQQDQKNTVSSLKVKGLLASDPSLVP